MVHGDIGCHNFLIQENGAIALADFGGSAIDGSMAQVGYAIRYERPQSISGTLNTASVKDDLFALGTVLYEISFGARIFPDLTDKEIRNRFKHREYPDLHLITCPRVRGVIRKCWDSEYEKAEEALCDLSEFHSTDAVFTSV